MEYNSSRPRLIIPEYGRNVQKMVDYLLTIEDRDERNKQAQNLIDIIGNLNPQIRDTPDFKHKLWDHLYIMSDFRLDVDSPYPKPAPETFLEKPEPVPYPAHNHKYRYYGNIIRKMVEYTANEEPGERKEELKSALANHMKKTYLTWNKDTVEDEVILTEMNALADGRLSLEDISLAEKQELIRNKHRNKNYKNRNNKGGKRRFKK